MSTHMGHRTRLKERFLREGLDSFSTHEVVELMLFYAIPQRDVNEIAHKLVERFGSLAGILEASIEDIQEVGGVGLHAATMFKAVSAITRRYALERGSAETRYTSIGQIGRFLVNNYIGVTVEQAHLMLFDSSMKLLDTVKVGDGVVNSVTITPRIVIEHAVKRNAAAVVLAHNHPGGIAMPSDEDVALTMRMRQILSACGITLIDHFVVADQLYNVIIGGKGREALQLGTAQLDFDRFYRDLDDRDGEGGDDSK